MKLLAKGAEADLYEAKFADLFFPSSEFGKIILKRRIPKGYRIPQIDVPLRRSRTVSEAKIIHDAGLAGTNVPSLLGVWIDSCTLVMEKIEGERLKEFLSEGGRKGTDACSRAGMQLGLLHRRGIVHGDPTTSNMILRDGEVFIIDFGLAEYSESIEKRAVDIHLLKTALKSTHFDHFEEFFRAVIDGYESEMGDESADVIERCTSIEKRGRYVER